MSKSKVFSRLDLQNGFYQIRMADGDIFTTSFSSPVGLSEWMVMPTSYQLSSFFSACHRSDVSLLWRIITPILSHIVQQGGSFTPPHQQHNPFLLEPTLPSAVANIKYLLANSTVLSIFDGSLSTPITRDTPSFGIGTVLEKQHLDGWRPTQFLSRSLSKPERNYPVT
ncbi:hypothetical protein Efla_002841 [Eimeria flavescens]